jgi:hypothetical protein
MPCHAHDQFSSTWRAMTTCWISLAPS